MALASEYDRVTQKTDAIAIRNIVRVPCLFSQYIAQDKRYIYVCNSIDFPRALDDVKRLKSHLHT